jgi:hypothetical protein
MFVVAMHNYDCITRRAVFRNADQRPRRESGSYTGKGNSKIIQKASSVTIDFEFAFKPFYMSHLTGRYDRDCDCPSFLR